MSLRWSHDSRSPTIGQTPSRNIPLRSIEGSNVKVQQLLDGLELQIREDRIQQDELLRMMKKMAQKISKIRKKQDAYLKGIRELLSDTQDEDEDQEENSQESQAQALTSSNGNERSDHSGADEREDSVLGTSTQPNENPNDPRGHHLPRRFGLGSPVRSAVAMVNEVAILDRSRGSTELGASHLLGLAIGSEDGITDTAQRTEAGAQPREGNTVTRRRISGTAMRKPPGWVSEPTAQPMILRSPGSFHVPNTPSVAGPSTIRPSLPKTPAHKGRGKRSADSSSSDGHRQPRRFKPTTASEPRPTRSAKTSATKKNKTIADYMRMSKREQSQVMHGQINDPFVNCYNCRAPNCKRCKDKGIAEDSPPIQTRTERS